MVNVLHQNSIAKQKEWRLRPSSIRGMLLPTPYRQLLQALKRKIPQNFLKSLIQFITYLTNSKAFKRTCIYFLSKILERNELTSNADSRHRKVKIRWVQQSDR
ncbi:hypothetical protein BC829DRAFT_180330 [Chytridium lagenaria]|nr:hypothetical protein BC829DRAFT_180330 [Chytridium lagenaria]